MTSFNWVGHGKFPNKEPFRWGNVQAADATAARAALIELWESWMPFAAPDFEPERGVLLFHPEQ